LTTAGCATGRYGPAPAGAERPPNIVLIVADDLGYGDVGPNGQAKIRTPSLDRMAREGTRFTQFYAGTAVCAPSRSTLMTGQHTGHTPVRGNRDVGPIGNQPLPDSAVTLAELLRARGYVTGIFGKWGLGGPDNEGNPLRQGFDEFYGYLDQARAHYYYPEFLFRGGERAPLPNRDRPHEGTPGAGWPIEARVYSHDTIASEALSFIERHRSQPFFLYVPFTIPHASLEVPDSALALYRDVQGRSVFPETPFPGAGYSPQPTPHAAYAAMVSRMDRDVGRILRKLEELGLAENTIVLFTSDNGPSIEGGSDPEFFDSNGPFRGHKRDLYEGGIREPMIAWAPGRVPAGRVSDQVWAMWDLLPTLASLAGVDPDALEVPGGLDGLDMTAALTGRGEAPQHDFLYWEFHEQGGKQAVRQGRWKAVRLNAANDPAAPLELYDLEADVGEARDVAAEHPEIVRRMAEIMARAHTPSELFPELDRAAQARPTAGAPRGR
jgi:arylsulfatase A-like enzyme